MDILVSELPLQPDEEYIVAIDPDATRSGVVILHPKSKTIIACKSMCFSKLFYLLSVLFLKKLSKLTVVIEGGWLNQSNWHLTSCSSFVQAASIGRKVGMNHQTGILLAEIAEEHFKFKVKVVKPLQKAWKGQNGKITHSEISKFIDLGGRSNQDERDAALLAWTYANLPIKL